ncbi:MAG TPA: N,N-dimethylformamidase beta subunit family domain-containing protein, partial [Bacteroidota bacterium]|nr:N,N-dimethylformamidase beta subunit family domain-containing protein [Bacteroidota bacterium]
KKASADPLNHLDDSLVTVNWISPPVNYPENLLLGTSGLLGGDIGTASEFPLSLGYGGIAAYNSQHWVYEGTNILDGATFGQKEAIAGYEVDGALFSWANGLPRVTGAADTTLKYNILGVSPSIDGKRRGHLTMGIYNNTQGGWVFNAATTGWAHGLSADPVVDRVTLNVIHRFLQNRFPPDIVSWSPARIEGDSIYHEWMYRNVRDTSAHPGLTFSIRATDPNNESIRYFWTLDDSIVSRDSTFTPHDSQQGGSPFVLVGHAYNTHDTSAISWKVGRNSGGTVPASSQKTLLQNYPNPFNPITTIQFTVERNEHATVAVFDQLGKEIATLFDGAAGPGRLYNVRFDAAKYPSGLYYYQLSTPSNISERRMLLVK